MNFARYRRHLSGFRKTTTNTQIIGFTESDSYQNVLTKASKGLGLHCKLSLLQLMCSGGMIPESPIEDRPWTLGRFIKHNGGVQNRSKKVWGVNVPIGVGEAGPSTSDSVSNNVNSVRQFLKFCIT